MSRRLRARGRRVPYTLVSFHAHPDDEVLLTGGTLARAAAEGHRVVIVVATAGEAGLTASADRLVLGQRRLDELRISAARLGCARVVELGYADSGMTGQVTPNGFSTVDIDEAAGKLAAVLDEEQADALTTYDPAGGYGHRDHVQVHHVGRRAAELAGTPVVLAATVDRAALQRALRLFGRLRRLPDEFAPARFEQAYSARDTLTHRVDVRRYSGAKRAAMAAHVSQGDTADRTLSLCLRLPRPVFRMAFGREWFVEQGRSPAQPLLDDVFASLR
jgi:LmbE family N-acetylglucosaminyl deacetylase